MREFNVTGEEEATMKYPVVECEDLGDGSWRFWCEHCRKHHTHSAGPGRAVTSSTPGPEIPQ
jgi:hypothetical protein